MDQHTELPWELILYIIDSLTPDRPGAMLPADDSTTQTLLSLCLVSRAILPAATRIFRKHCVYIDSRRRAHLFVENFLSHQIEPLVPLSRIPISQIMLAPYAGFSWDDGAELTKPTLRPLAFGEFIDPTFDIPTSQLVRSILMGLAPTLRTLVIDIELRYMYPDEEILHYQVRSILREAFESVVNVEEFVCIRDELYLPRTFPDWNFNDIIWTHSWKKLRRLCLYNLDLNVEYSNWRAIRQSPALEELVLVRAETDIVREEPNLKEAWISTAKLAGQAREPPDRITMTWVNVQEDLPDFDQFATQWQQLDPQGHVNVLVVSLPYSRTGQHVIALTQAFIKEHATMGSLFDAEALGARPAICNSSSVRPS